MKPLFPKFAQSVAALSFCVAALSSSGCSLKSAGNKKLHLSFPKISSAGSLTAMTAPSSLSDFTCFGVNVSGSGIARDPRMSCGQDSDFVGILGGFVPLSGGDIDLVVPSGAARKIEVFAVQSTVGCPPLGMILNRPPAPGARFSGMGTPYKVGEVVADVFTDTSVAVRVGFTGSSVLFSSCSDFQPSSAVFATQSFISVSTAGARLVGPYHHTDIEIGRPVPSQILTGSTAKIALDGESL